MLKVGSGGQFCRPRKPSRFDGLVDATSSSSSPESSDAASLTTTEETLYKHYLQVIYTPHNMATAVDKDSIRQAYEDVRSDNSDTEWAVFKFEGNNLNVTATGKDFKDFKSAFTNDDRGFGYIRISTGDEMSKRAKFVFVTWVGPSVSVMKKAKMSTDKALMKDIIQNLSVELQLENHAEFSHDFFKGQVDRASGARYGTGERAL